MPKLKIANRFGIIPNKLLNDTNISWKAKGLFGYLQSKPDDWDFAVKRICKESSDGEKSTISGIKELEKAGYLKRKKYQNELGHRDIEYILYDTPTAYNRQQETNTVADNPVADNPVADNRQTKKERITKEEIKNNKYISNEKINKKFSLFLEHRRQMKKPMTDIAIGQATEKVEGRLDIYSVDQIDFIIDKSIENSWQGLFDDCLKTYGKDHKNTQAYQNKKAREEFIF